MKSFLWSQSASLTGKDIFIIDGNVSHYFGEPIQNEAMAFMDSNNFKVFDRHEENSSTSLSYRISESREAIQLAGNFREKDECGRYLVYVLSIKSKTEDVVLNTLQDYSTKIGLTLYEEDITSFRLYFQKKERRKLLQRILCCGLIVLSIVTIIVAIINH